VRVLQAEREARGLSGYELARRCGLSQSTLSLLDRGKRTPTLDTVLRIVAVLEVDLGAVVRAAAGGEIKGRMPAPERKADKPKARRGRAG
jgi:transcriptional regulator with XRE-family HTH domain